MRIRSLALLAALAAVSASGLATIDVYAQTLEKQNKNHNHKPPQAHGKEQNTNKPKIAGNVSGNGGNHLPKIAGGVKKHGGGGVAGQSDESPNESPNTPVVNNTDASGGSPNPPVVNNTDVGNESPPDDTAVGF